MTPEQLEEFKLNWKKYGLLHCINDDEDVLSRLVDICREVKIVHEALHLVNYTTGQAESIVVDNELNYYFKCGNPKETLNRWVWIGKVVRIDN